MKKQKDLRDLSTFDVMLADTPVYKKNSGVVVRATRLKNPNEIIRAQIVRDYVGR
jgi:hypothetical protein